MKKILYLFIFIFAFAQMTFAHSVLSKNEEEYVINKDIPFFINIIPTNDDLRYDFDEEHILYNPQVHFFNKKMEESSFTESNAQFFISARRYKSVSAKKYQSDAVELKTNYKIGKWDLKGSLSQETISGLNKYFNYISFEPEYKLTKNISILGGISHSLSENYDQTKLGLKYTPLNFKRLEFEVSISNYTKQFGSYRQKLNFNTNLKI